MYMLIGYVLKAVNIVMGLHDCPKKGVMTS